MTDRTIAIDGPAASGKSTLAQKLASALGYLYFDTGVMYRAATLAAIQSGIPVEDEAAVSRLAERLSIDVQPPGTDDGRQYDVLLDAKDVTWAIRTPEVDASVSLVSSYADVRNAMTERQREIGRRGGVVMVGRDIGTVVMPEAEVKIYLEASVEARAQRRYQELLGRGEEVELEQVLQSVRARDEFDTSREHAPLRVAPDAVVLDSTELDPEQVLQAALKIVEANDRQPKDP